MRRSVSSEEGGTKPPSFDHLLRSGSLNLLSFIDLIFEFRQLLHLHVCLTPFRGEPPCRTATYCVSQKEDCTSWESGRTIVVFPALLTEVFEHRFLRSDSAGSVRVGPRVKTGSEQRCRSCAMVVIG